MLKSMKLSQAVRDLQLPLNYLVECMIDADHGTGHFYAYVQPGNAICIAVKQNEILAVRSDEVDEARCLGLNLLYYEGIGWVNLDKMRTYLCAAVEPKDSS
jgi:hypothetical protein